MFSDLQNCNVADVGGHLLQKRAPIKIDSINNIQLLYYIAGKNRNYPIDSEWVRFSVTIVSKGVVQCRKPRKPQQRLFWYNIANHHFIENILSLIIYS